jgi:hypothetical protein
VVAQWFLLSNDTKKQNETFPTVQQFKADCRLMKTKKSTNNKNKTAVNSNDDDDCEAIASGLMAGCRDDEVCARVAIRIMHLRKQNARQQLNKTIEQYVDDCGTKNGLSRNECSDFVAKLDQQCENDIQCIDFILGFITRDNFLRHHDLFPTFPTHA